MWSNVIWKSEGFEFWSALAEFDPLCNAADRH